MTAAIVIIIIILLVLALALYLGMLDRLHISPKPRPGQRRVACVGDSITYGFFVRDQLRNNYPSVLQRLLGEGYCVGNFGFSNRTASTDGDYPYTREKLYKKSLDFRPDIVLIMLGSNDSKPNNWNGDSYARSLTELSRSYMALDSRPRVLLMTPPSVFHFWKKVLWTIQGDVLETSAAGWRRSWAWNVWTSTAHSWAKKSCLWTAATPMSPAPGSWRRRCIRR